MPGMTLTMLGMTLTVLGMTPNMLGMTPTPSVLPSLPACRAPVSMTWDSLEIESRTLLSGAGTRLAWPIDASESRFQTGK